MDRRQRDRRITPCSGRFLTKDMPISFIFVQNPPTETGIRRPGAPTELLRDQIACIEMEVTAPGRNTFNAKTNENARKRNDMRGVWTTRKDQVYRTRDRKEKDMRKRKNKKRKESRPDK